MQLRIHSNGSTDTYNIDDNFLEKVVDGVIEMAFMEVDKIPMARSSIKAVLGTGMRLNGVKNPDPAHMTDIDFAVSLLKNKLGGYLSQNGLDTYGEKVDSQ